MALTDTLMSSSDTVFDAVADSLVDAGELVMDATFGSPDGGGMSGRNLRRGLLVLIVVGAIIGIAFWKRTQSSAPAAATDPATGAPAGGA